MFFYLITGITLGLSSGLSPGPLFALVISETLNHGRKAGIKVAITPLITDIPVILLSYFVINLFANSDLIYAVLSLVGGLFIGYLAFDVAMTAEFKTTSQVKVRSLQKGIITNLLNPSIYIFWFTIGIPTVLKGFELGILHVFLFVVPFYVCLVGSKILLAILISRTGEVNRKVLRYINIVLRIILIGLAVKFIYDGILYFIS